MNNNNYALFSASNETVIFALYGISVAINLIIVVIFLLLCIYILKNTERRKAAVACLKRRNYENLEDNNNAQ